MSRKSPVLLVALAPVLLAACSFSRPVVVTAGVTCPPDPKTAPSAASAAAESAADTAAAVEKGARVGRRVGIVAGLISAVFGAESEDIRESIDRYRRTRDTATVVGAIIGGATAGTESAEPAVADPFAGLRGMAGIEIVESSDLIELRLAGYPSEETLAAIAAAIEGCRIDVEAPGDQAVDLRAALIDHGIPPSSINARRGAAIVIRLRLDV